MGGPRASSHGWIEPADENTQAELDRLSHAEKLEIARSGTVVERAGLASIEDLPIEAMLLIATDPEPFVRFSLQERRDIPEAVIAAALDAYPLDAPNLSWHWSAPPKLMESVALTRLLEPMIQAYFDAVAASDECQERVWRLRDTAASADDDALTLGQAMWIASQPAGTAPH